jgi:hypothetical protein
VGPLLSYRFLFGGACSSRDSGDPLVGVYAKEVAPLLRGDPKPGGGGLLFFILELRFEASGVFEKLRYFRARSSFDTASRSACCGPPLACITKPRCGLAALSPHQEATALLGLSVVYCLLAIVYELLSVVCCLLPMHCSPCSGPSGAGARSGPNRSPCTGSWCARARSGPCRSPCTGSWGARAGSSPCRSPCSGPSGIRARTASVVHVVPFSRPPCTYCCNDRSSFCFWLHCWLRLCTCGCNLCT